MKVTHFLAGLGLAVIMQPGLGFANARDVLASLPNGVSSGDTSSTSTVLWARCNRKGEVKFLINKDNVTVQQQTVTVTDPLIPAKISVENLQPGQHYTYQVSTADGMRLTGQFTTAPDQHAENLALSFGVTGDWRGELAPYPAIKNIPAKELNFFIKLGDTIYADYPTSAVPLEQALTLHDYRLKHKEVYSRHAGVNSFAKLQKDVSIFSMIDDHEVKNDFAGGALASAFPYLSETTGLVNQSSLYKSGLQAFTEYNAIADKTYPVVGDALTDGRPDLYRSQRYGKTAAVYLLDSRSFRDTALAGVTDTTDPQQIGGFIAQAFDASTPASTRTMLGKAQLDRLKADLLAAQSDNVLWKFIALPEPIQNMGVLAASDRFEGYASERSELLRFIDENAVHNVVFISADIHGSLVNDLTYQRREEVLNALVTVGNPLAAPQIKTSAFDISTGSVAFAPAFGVSVIELLTAIPNGDAILAQLYGAVGVSDLAGFNQLPMAVKDAAMTGIVNAQLTPLGYTSVGLDDNERIHAKLTKGSYSALFNFGWTRFDIAPDTQNLKVTTYGIEPYSIEDMQTNSVEMNKRRPKILNQFVVTPNR
ncbi:MAG: alkaline phosphatase D family protein [Methylovulum sp.]